MLQKNDVVRTTMINRFCKQKKMEEAATLFKKINVEIAFFGVNNVFWLVLEYRLNAHRLLVLQ